MSVERTKVSSSLSRKPNRIFSRSSGGAVKRTLHGDVGTNVRTSARIKSIWDAYRRIIHRYFDNWPCAPTITSGVDTAACLTTFRDCVSYRYWARQISSTSASEAGDQVVNGKRIRFFRFRAPGGASVYSSTCSHSYKGDRRSKIAYSRKVYKEKCEAYTPDSEWMNDWPVVIISLISNIMTHSNRLPFAENRTMSKSCSRIFRLTKGINRIEITSAKLYYRWVPIISLYSHCGFNLPSACSKRFVITFQKHREQGNLLLNYFFRY